MGDFEQSGNNYFANYDVKVQKMVLSRHNFKELKNFHLGNVNIQWSNGWSLDAAEHILSEV